MVKCVKVDVSMPAPFINDAENSLHGHLHGGRGSAHIIVYTAGAWT